MDKPREGYTRGEPWGYLQKSKYVLGLREGNDSLGKKGKKRAKKPGTGRRKLEEKKGENGEAFVREDSKPQKRWKSCEKEGCPSLWVYGAQQNKGIQVLRIRWGGKV